MPARLGGIDEQRSGGRLDLPAVDRQLYEISHLSASPEPAGWCLQTNRAPHCAACASNSSRNFSTNEIVGIAAASPSGQNVRPSMFFATSSIRSMSCGRPMPSSNRAKHLLQPRRAFAARNAPAAALMLVELHDAQRGLHHVGVLIHDDHAARAQHALRFHERVVVHREIALLRLQHRARRSAGDHRLQLLARSTTPPPTSSIMRMRLKPIGSSYTPGLFT